MSLIIDPYRFATGDTFVMPYRQDVLGWSSIDGSSGVTYTRTQNSGALGGGIATHSGAADADDGDYLEWFVNLAAGTYTVTSIYRKGADHGIHDVKLDGTSLGTFDAYGASTTYNNVSTITGVTVAADGNYTLRVAINGKHASSSDYLLGVQTVTLHRSGA